MFLKSACLSILLGITTLSMAQDASVQRITLENAIELALENNIGLKQLGNRLAIQDANIQSAFYDFFPNLNAGMNANQSTGRQFSAERLGAGLDPYADFTTRSVSGSLSSSVVLYNGFANVYTLRAANSSKLSADESYLRQREIIIFQTASAYLGILLDEELLDISRQNLTSSEQQLEQIQAQVEVGMRPIVDQYNQEALVATNEFDVIQRENSLNIAKLNLIKILFLDPLAEYEFVTPGIDEASLQKADYNLVELVNEAMANRRDLKAQEASIIASRYNYQIAKSGYLPTLSASGSLSGSYSDQFRELVVGGAPGQRQTVSFLNQFTDRNRRYGFGASLQVPIFNRYNTRRQIQIAQIEYKNAQLDLDSRKQEIFQEVRQAYNDYIAVTKQLETTEKALIAATKAYETEQERYRVGASTLIELTRANTEFVRASSNRVQAMYRFVFQEKLLDYYLGKIETDITF